MFFSAKYRNRGGSNSGRGKQRGFEYVLEITAAAQQQMASSVIKFDSNSPAALKLQAAVFEKIKQLWDATIDDDSGAKYAVALASKGTERKKMEAQLSVIFGEDTSNVLCEWIITYIRKHREELLLSKGASKKSGATAKVAALADAKPAPAPVVIEPEPAPVEDHPLLQHQDEVLDDFLDDEAGAYVEEPAEKEGQAAAAATAAATPTAAAAATGQPMHREQQQGAGRSKVEWHASQRDERDGRQEDRRDRGREEKRGDRRDSDRIDAQRDERLGGRGHERERDRNDRGGREDRRWDERGGGNMESQRHEQAGRDWDRGKRDRGVDVAREERGRAGTERDEQWRRPERERSQDARRRGEAGPPPKVSGDRAPTELPRQRSMGREAGDNGTRGGRSSRSRSPNDGLSPRAGVESVAARGPPKAPATFMLFKNALKVSLPSAAALTDGGSRAPLGVRTSSARGEDSPPKRAVARTGVFSRIQSNRGQEEVSPVVALPARMQAVKAAPPQEKGKGSVFERLGVAMKRPLQHVVEEVVQVEEESEEPQAAKLVQSPAKQPRLAAPDLDEPKAGLSSLGRGTVSIPNAASMRPRPVPVPHAVSMARGPGPTPHAVSTARGPGPMPRASSAERGPGPGPALRGASADRGPGPGPIAPAATVGSAGRNRGVGPGPKTTGAAGAATLGVGRGLGPGPKKPMAQPPTAAASASVVAAAPAQPASAPVDHAALLQEMAAKVARLQADIEAARLAAGQRTVVVQQLPQEATDQHLKAFFKLCGQVRNVTFQKDSVSGLPSGTAFVELDSDKSARKAVELSGCNLAPVGNPCCMPVTVSRKVSRTHVQRSGPSAAVGSAAVDTSLKNYTWKRQEAAKQAGADSA